MLLPHASQGNAVRREGVSEGKQSLHSRQGRCGTILFSLIILISLSSLFRFTCPRSPMRENKTVGERTMGHITILSHLGSTGIKGKEHDTNLTDTNLSVSGQWLC